MISDKIKKIREEKGITQISLAKAIGKNKMQYWRIENGKVVIDADTLRKIAVYLEVDINIFFEK